MSKEIEKKCWQEYFEKILSGEKTYDLRLADWDCETGDTLILVETDTKGTPTGRTVRRKVGYIGKIKDFNFWPPEEVEKHGYQIISLLDRVE